MNKSFDQLYRMQELSEILGLDKSTIYRMIKKGTFPKQIRISDQCVAWSRAQIEEWLEERARLSA